jgi:hypothetical protein
MRPRTTPLTVAALTALLVLVARPAAAGPPKQRELSLYYDQVINTSKGSLVTKVWVKGDKKRTETDNQGVREIDVIAGSIHYHIFPDQGFARRMPPLTGSPSLAPATPSEIPMSAAGEIGGAGTGVTSVGSDNVANIPCKIYMWKSGDAITRIWMSDILPFPLKWEELDRKEGDFSYEIRNLKVAAEIPDSYFELPAGVRVLNE